MKKIPVLTIVLIVVLVLNVSLMLVTGVNLSSASTKKRYTPSSDYSSEGYSSIKYYEVKYGTIIDYEYFNATISYSSDAFSTYAIEEKGDLNLFDKISEGQKIGVKDSSDVVCLKDSMIVDITQSESDYFIKCFNFEEAYVNLTIEYTTFYRLNSNDYSYKLFINDNEYNLEFQSVNMYSTTDSNLEVKFKIENFDLFLSKGYNVKIGKVNKKYTNVYYLENCYCIDKNYQRSFLYNDNGQVNTISVFCKDYINNNVAIIEAIGLKAGMELYE